MDRFFIFVGETNAFAMFSKEHLIAITIVFWVLGMIKLNREWLYKHDKSARYTIAFLLITQEIILNINRVMNGVWSMSESLPFHLCSFSVILIAIMMVTDSYKLFEIQYFWGLVGAPLAILTPDLTNYGFPHFRFYQFFFSHGMILVGVFYMVFVKGYKPTLKSLGRSIMYTNIILPFIGIINWFTGGNYFFIARKPVTGSLLDFLGPWPYYIIWIEVLGLVLFFLCLLPVLLIKKQGEQSSI